MKLTFKHSRPLTYLCCPYSHFLASVRRERFEEVTCAAAFLMRHHPRKYGNVFSPITHSHPLHELAGMDGSWDFWKRIDTEYLRLSKNVVVLKLSGWEESTGVTEEIKIAKRFKLPIRYLNPNEII